MILRILWIAYTAGSLPLSSAAARVGTGGFFYPRPQQWSRQITSQVQQVQQTGEAIVTRLAEETRREGRVAGVSSSIDRLSSNVVAALGGVAGQQSRKATKTPESKDANDHATPSAAGSPPVAGAPVEQSQPAADTTSSVAVTTAGLGDHSRILRPVLETIPSAGRQLTLRARSILGLKELRPGSSALLTRGGGAAPTQLEPSSPDEGDKWKNAIEGLKNGLASGLAAACVKTALQPFDTMKTVQQYSTTRMTLLQAGRNLLARGGVPELYQGLGVTLIGSMPAVGVYFGLYQFVKKQLDAKQGMSPYLSITVSAGVGNFIASFFRVPYEVVKQRLQVGQYPTTSVALTSIYREDGLLGFFGKSGLKMQWARDIPYAMVTLLVYETLQKAAARRKCSPGSEENSNSSERKAQASPLENMVIGAIAGGMGSLVTNPMDMIKTRMMTSPELYAGPMDAAWKALSKEGPHAFLKGATPRLLHKIPANAFFFVAYEFFRTALGVTR
ncbi:unnamed protein product [Hapterophycus canaliculatus]